MALFSLSSCIRRFAADSRGAVAMMFAVGAVGILGVAGLAMDYSRGSRAKAALFAAADSAALAGARFVGTATEREDVARRTFQANLKQADYEYLNVAMRPENVTREGRNYGFRVGASAEIPTTLSKVLGFQDVGVSVLAEAIGVLTTPTEVVMALDTTYSMTGWKINTLKDAATRLVDDLRPWPMTARNCASASFPSRNM